MFYSPFIPLFKRSSLLAAFCLLTMWLFCSCKSKKESKVDQQTLENLALKQVDLDFSKHCKSKGMKESFIEYMDSNAILLRPMEDPIVGADVIMYLTDFDDKSFSYDWRTERAEVAQSGDLGYTYGIYLMQSTDASANKIYGTYASIWKKQSDGKWKMLLHTLNEGLKKHDDFKIPE